MFNGSSSVYNFTHFIKICKQSILNYSLLR